MQSPDIAGPTALPAAWQLHAVPVHVWILTNSLNFVSKKVLKSAFQEGMERANTPLL